MQWRRHRPACLFINLTSFGLTFLDHQVHSRPVTHHPLITMSTTTAPAPVQNQKPLTYQPFANAPAIAALRTELSHNVGAGERALCGLLGAALITGGFRLRGLSILPTLALGAAFVLRAASGHCALYERMGIDTRKPNTSVAPPDAV